MNDIKTNLEEYQPINVTVEELRKLDMANIIKNTFLLDIAERINNNSDFNTDTKKIEYKEIESIIKFIHRDIDGIVQYSSELINTNGTVNLISEELKRLS